MGHIVHVGTVDLQVTYGSKMRILHFEPISRCHEADVYFSFMLWIVTSKCWAKYFMMSYRGRFFWDFPFTKCII